MTYKLAAIVTAIALLSASELVSADDLWSPYQPSTPYWEPAQRAYANEPIEVYTLDGFQGIYEPNDSGGYDYWSVDKGYEATTVRDRPYRY